MKTYLKILAITATIQIAGFALTFFIDNMLIEQGRSTIIPIFIGGFCLVISIVLGIVLPIKWCSSKSHKMMTIVFLPTNYTWLLIAVAVAKLVGNILDILDSIPANFG